MIAISFSVIRDLGCSPGIVLNPATPVSYLDYVLEKLDLILVMTVNPGFGGQKFLSSQLRKIENLRKKIDKIGKKIELEVDGGINEETSKIVASAGADVLVSGSYIFGSGNYAGAIKKLRG